VGGGGSAGKPAIGGSSGSIAGDGGMMDTAGAMDTGGEGAEGGTAATAGTAASAGSGAVTAGGGAGGKGGSAGAMGGSGGTIAGSGGTLAGSGGTLAGTGGSAGSGGSPPANGCAKLVVPIDDNGDRAHFVISLTSPVDMTAAVVSMRVYVQAGVGGTIFSYVQDGSPNYHFFGVTTAKRPELATLSGWTTLTFDVGGQDPGSTGIAKTAIKRVGIEINALPSTSWSNPTIVYVDSISVTTPTLSFPLDTMPTVSTSASSGLDVSGQVLWLNSASSDTTAAGVTLTWQATCP